MLLVHRLRFLPILDVMSEIAEKGRNAPTPRNMSHAPRNGALRYGKHGPGKTRLITRDHLDGRTRARRQFDAIASGIAQDLGGEGQLSTVQKHLVEAFAGAAINVNDLNARLLMGEKIDIVDHSQAISTMVRIAARIGVHRIAKQVPDLQEFLQSRYASSDAPDEDEPTSAELQTEVAE